jgi:hypothetical protein
MRSHIPPAIPLIAAFVVLSCQRGAAPPAAQQSQRTQQSFTESPPAAEMAKPPKAPPAPAAEMPKPRLAPPAPAPAPPAPPPPKQATLAAGTPLTVRTTNTLSTKVVKTGERFLATLEEPLVSGTWVIAPKGSTVEGKIVEADEGGRVKGVASLTVALTGLTTADGRRVPIETNTVSVQAKSSVKKDVARTGIASGIGAAIGAIAGGGKGAAIGAGVGAGAGAAGTLATRGDPAVIPAETVLHFELTAPVTVTEAR